VSTIKAILEANSDVTLHLPVPPELRQGKLSVTATIEPAECADGKRGDPSLKGFGCLKGKIWLAPDFNEPLPDFADYME
jgi:hypothetical protein